MNILFERDLEDTKGLAYLDILENKIKNVVNLLLADTNKLALDILPYVEKFH